MAATSLFSENESKDHKYQLLDKPGPRGAYEARQVNAGFYVRVDMPGVPPDGVKLVKRGETRTVTFTGKAPRLWPDCETSDRVYGGYVVLDRNPDEIDVQMNVVNGSLKLFFPNADGILHFFAPKNRFSQQYQDLMPESLSITHINPYLLDGLEGLVERMLVNDATGDRMYTRVDMPGLGERNKRITVQDRVKLFFEGEGTLEHPFDEGGRDYGFCLSLRCTCCKIIDVKQEMKDGVFRFWFRKRTLPSSSGIECMLDLLRVSRTS